MTTTATRAGRAALALACIFGLTAPSAHASTLPKVAKGAVLTYGELYTCAQEAVQIRRELEQHRLRSKAISERRASLFAERAALTAERPMVTVADPRAIAHDLASNQLDRDIDSHNAAIEATQARKERQAAACADRMFRKADLERLPEDLRQAVRDPGPAPARPAFSYDEVAACGAKAAALEDARVRLEELDAAMAPRRDAARAESRALEEIKAGLDPKKLREVAAYNARARRHLQTMEGLSAELADRNAVMTARNADVVAYEAACTGRSFREADISRLAAPQQAAIRKQLVGGKGVK